MKVVILSLAAVLGVAQAMEQFNEIKIMDGHKKRSQVVSPLPHT